MTHPMNREMLLVLPYPPSVNKTWKRSKTGMYLSNEAKDYRKSVQWIIVPYLAGAAKSFFSNCQLKVELKMYPPDNRKRDIDNILKCVLDSLQHANVFDDDACIHKLYVEKLHAVSEGRVHVRISMIIPNLES